MIIYAHRGYWIEKAEKNSLVAFKRAFNEGFGVELDIRDYNEDLVISHGVPSASSLQLRDLFQLYSEYDNLPLALNIKADGLQDMLDSLIKQYEIENYFVFDMSVPEGLRYLQANMNVFTRQSEYELEPSFYKMASGVWMDQFLNNWISKEAIYKHAKYKKNICIVSPELHGRPIENQWAKYIEFQRIMGDKNIMICTDKPHECREYFK
jgi:hypothetical protein